MVSVSHRPQFIRPASWVPSTSLNCLSSSAPFAHRLGSRYIYSLNLRVFVEPSGVGTGYIAVNKHGKITGALQLTFEDTGGRYGK